MISEEQNHWDQWNLHRVQEGLVRERLILCEAAVDEVRSLPIKKGGAFLDIACGAGWTSERLHREFDYVGMDLGPESIAAARARVPEARFVTADYVDWEEKPSHYEAILCVDAITCFHQQEAAVAKMHRELKPGGWLVMTALNPMIYSRMSWVGPPGEGQARKWLTRGALHTLLQNAGFILLKSRTVAPGGDTGMLHVINARKVNRLMSVFLGRNGWTRLKEKLQLGQFRIVVAQKAS
jgi:2-polyprenyl-3-methyl-5-hydroxy-6-metoxy-1,4-benzoquinol methylase